MYGNESTSDYTGIQLMCGNRSVTADQRSKLCVSVDPQNWRQLSMPVEQNALARLLQERREAAGYSRARLGALVGVSAGTIEGWELGRVGRPPFHDVIRIASFLRIPLDDLQGVAFADAGEIPDSGDN